VEPRKQREQPHGQRRRTHQSHPSDRKGFHGGNARGGGRPLQGCGLSVRAGRVLGQSPVLHVCLRSDAQPAQVLPWAIDVYGKVWVQIVYPDGTTPPSRHFGAIRMAEQMTGAFALLGEPGTPAPVDRDVFDLFWLSPGIYTVQVELAAPGAMGEVPIEIYVLDQAPPIPAGFLLPPRP
jgi:hypothetical protein